MDGVDKKYYELNEQFERIPKEIGSLIEITPKVWEILGSLYKTEVIYTKNIEIISQNTFKIHCNFPKYNLSVDELDHISNVQMQVVLNQALYLAIGLTIRQNGVDSPISYKTFLLNRMNVKYRRDERVFRKELQPGEDAFLILQVEPIIKKGNLYTITTKLLKRSDCFIDGKVECLLQDKYLK